MNTIKSLGLVGLAVAGLFATQAYATVTCPSGSQGAPVCISITSGLQTNVDNMTVSGPTIDVYTDQTSTSGYWSIGSTSGSENTVAFAFDPSNTVDSFGIYDPTHPTTRLELFNNASGVGYSTLSRAGVGGAYSATYYDSNVMNAPIGFASATFGSTNYFGYYITTENGTFYSDASLNEAGGNTYPDGTPHDVVYAGNGQTVFQTGATATPGTFLLNEYLLAWEGQSWGTSDLDYNDFGVLVESVEPVPEPAVLGMFGFGILLIGGFTALRRRRAHNV